MKRGRLTANYSTDSKIIDHEFSEVEGEEIDHTFGAIANTQETISHGLAKVPTRAYAIYKDRACDVYDSGTAWTNTAIYLKCTVASAVVIIKVL